MNYNTTNIAARKTIVERIDDRTVNIKRQSHVTVTIRDSGSRDYPYEVCIRSATGKESINMLGPKDRLELTAEVKAKIKGLNVVEIEEE